MIHNFLKDTNLINSISYNDMWFYRRDFNYFKDMCCKIRLLKCIVSDFVFQKVIFFFFEIVLKSIFSKWLFRNVLGVAF